MRTALWITVAVSLASCQKRDPLFCGMNPSDPRCALEDGGIIPPGFVTISGTVTGLTGSGLVLQNNGADDKLVVSSGSFTFATPVPMGTPYTITVSTQPTNPSQTCTVSAGSGTANDNVTDVVVDCTTASYTVGGTVVGCNGGCAGVLTLTDNGGDDLLINANGTFTFLTKVASQSPYNVAVKGTTGPSCMVAGGAGIVGNANITSIVVNCTPGTFILSGTPPSGGTSGLNGTVTLHAAYTTPSGSDTIMVSTNSFAFPTPLVTNQGFTVTVSGQPQYPPANQNCTVMGGTGTINGANYPSVKVNCATNMFSIGGNVMGLNAGNHVTLQNGGDSKMVNNNGGFTFNTMILSGLTYNVTVSSQPSNQFCSVSRGSGTVANGNVTNVVVTCGDPGIKCGSGYCMAGTQQCCDPNGSPQCIGISQSCGSLALPCDDKADCSGGKLCCAMTHNGTGSVLSVGCSSSCGGSNPVQLCDPATNECASGSCQSYSQLPGDYACQ